jgi:hypothetical protein
MKIKVGFDDKETGTAESTPEGKIVFDGTNPGGVEQLVLGYAKDLYEDGIEGDPDPTADAVLAYVVEQLSRGTRMWAEVVYPEGDGETQSETVSPGTEGEEADEDSSEDG